MALVKKIGNSYYYLPSFTVLIVMEAGKINSILENQFKILIWKNKEWE